MARIESVALGGYYPTPPHLVPLIASQLRLALAPPPEERWRHHDAERLSVLDPCAGEGTALSMLVSGLEHGRLDLFAVELETTRHEACRKALDPIIGWATAQKQILHGDAFRVQFRTERGIGVLYLNPPYDQDRQFKRLEARWLDRFTQTLAIGGVLVFVVPHYALAACADILGMHYENLRCLRFPGEDFDAFKQVVLLATRCESRNPIFGPDPLAVALVNRWAESVDGMAPLDMAAEPTHDVEKNRGGAAPFHYQEGWMMRGVDYTSMLAKFRPWHATMRAGSVEPMDGIVPPGQVRDSLLRVYPVATPPRPAHIASGIAAGIFNGARIRPNPVHKDRLPELLVKGVFDREYRTVEEKLDKDGNVKGEIQVQQPRLVTTVLDLSTAKFHTLGDGVETTGALDVSKMNVADLLACYGTSLMHAMIAQCPTLYDPKRDADSIALHESPRTPFTAQAHAAKAIVKLIAQPDQSAVLLGEIGSGKSTVSLLAARTVGAKRILVMCPPHLLDSWQNEATAVAPDLHRTVIQSIADLDRLPPEPLLAILSRETAKLSHGVAQVDRCPKCGEDVPPGDLAKKRARCEAQAVAPHDLLATAARELAVYLTAYTRCETMGYVLGGRFDRVRLEKQKQRETFVAPPAEMLWPALVELVRVYTSGGEDKRALAIFNLCFALNRPEWTAMVVASLMERNDYSAPSLARALSLMLPTDHPAQTYRKHDRYGTGDYSIAEHAKHVEALAAGEVAQPYSLDRAELQLDEDGTLMCDGRRPGDLETYKEVLRELAHLGRWERGPECGEFLWQGVPEPRRYAVAKYITRYHKDTFDFVIIDECHEAATDGSAQERAAHRLTDLGVPTLIMSGSIMNGYAESLFTNMWAVSSDFRREFARDECSEFVNRFGYRKRMVEDREDGKIVAFGSHSDRVERTERIIGNAPGVLPLFVLRHLLPVSVTLHKADLAIDLPTCHQIRHNVKPSEELRKEYDRLKDALVKQIRADMFQEGLAGKLFGQLAELPSYLDRATRDVGNNGGGSYAIHYPESVGGALVAESAGFDEGLALPKEQWMLDTLVAELERGRNCIVFCWHVGLLPRLQRLIEAHIGERIAVLNSDKVPTGKRQAWIEKEVVGKRRHVLLTNPVSVSTGLNALTWFSVELWLENPACNPLVYRQAIGRVDRVGQQAEDTRVHFATYANTLQDTLYDLLMRKTAVSTATDGLDPEAALAAAGLDSGGYLAGLSLGKALWRLMSESSDTGPAMAHRGTPLDAKPNVACEPTTPTCSATENAREVTVAREAVGA